MKRAATPLQQLHGGVQRDTHVRILTEREAAEHCRYFDRGCADPVRAFQQWARRAGVPVKYAGRKRLYDPRILDAFLERDTWTRRHRSPVKPVSRHLHVIRHTGESVGETR